MRCQVKIKSEKLKMKNEKGHSAHRGENSPRDIGERTFEFAVRIIQLCKHLDERPGVGRVLMGQILHSGTSVPSNIEEAQAGQSKADFISKMYIALKEARETHMRLRLLATATVVPENQLQPLISEAEEIKRVLGAIIVSSKRNVSP
jgi:four helix bundle protein